MDGVVNGRMDRVTDCGMDGTTDGQIDGVMNGGMGKAVDGICSNFYLSELCHK